ncbi:MAG: hypothetical protein EBR82_27470 [Caulobacteraceae bacterium]|nr:hypothetical protein [Caulobacteraceae bacterium]
MAFQIVAVIAAATMDARPMRYGRLPRAMWKSRTHHSSMANPPMDADQDATTNCSHIGQDARYIVDITIDFVHAMLTERRRIQ